jgi:hypothetical protein
MARCGCFRGQQNSKMTLHQSYLQVYAIAAYVEGKKATHEFGIRSRGGFFDNSGTSEYADAILDAACSKLLVVHLVRDIEGTTFADVR